MERSLDSIVEEIAQNDEMSREFAAMDEMDEIYQYCRDAGLDYSEEEFDDEVASLIGELENSGTEVSDYQLSAVAGGKNEPKTKGALILHALLNKKY